MSGELFMCGQNGLTISTQMEQDALQLAMEQERLRREDGLIADLDDERFWRRVWKAQGEILRRLEREARERAEDEAEIEEANRRRALMRSKARKCSQNVPQPEPAAGGEVQSAE